MSRKFFIFIAVMILLLSACAPAATPTPTTIPPTATTEPTETSEPTPESTATEVPEPTAEPTEAATAEPELMTFNDDLGHTIELADYPQRIVSLSPSTTEILFAVGAGDQVVGREDFSLYPEEALAVQSVGSMWGDLPSESILALEPDLIVVAEIISQEQVQALQDLGLNVYWQANPEDFEGLYKNMSDLAAITGHTEQADAMIADLQARVDDVLAVVATAETVPSTFYELDGSDPANPWTVGSGTFTDYIITLAGGTNAAAALQGEYAQISAEELIAVNPDVILLGDALYGVSVESVAERSGWDVITAVQNGTIYPIDPNIISVPGPRLVDALEETAKLLHPDLFE